MKQEEEELKSRNLPCCCCCCQSKIKKALLKEHKVDVLFDICFSFV
jgi:hypothetical protein